MPAPPARTREPSPDVFAERYALSRDRLSPALRRVAAFIDANRMDVITLSAADLGRAIGTSDATVIRAVQAMGFEGLHDLRTELAASYGSRNRPADNLVRTWSEVGESAEAAMNDVLESLTSGLAALQMAPFRAALTEALKVLHVAQRIVIFGVGPTAHVAAYFAARLRRKGRRQMVLDRTGTGLADQLLELARGDAMLMLAYGEPYREAQATLQEARRLQLPVVLITDSPTEGLNRDATVVLTVPRGRGGRVALHGTTVACLEMLLLGLATTGRAIAISTLSELDRLREATRPTQRRVRPGTDTNEND